MAKPKPAVPPPAPAAPKVNNWPQAACWAFARMLDNGLGLVVLTMGFLGFLIWRLSPEGVERLLLVALNSRLFATLGWILFLFSVAVAAVVLRWQHRIHREELERRDASAVKPARQQLIDLPEEKR
jgi:magnesium-transporting ATPase (P-type)